MIGTDKNFHGSALAHGRVRSNGQTEEEVNKTDAPDHLRNSFGSSRPKTSSSSGLLQRKDLQPREDYRYQYHRFVLMIALQTPGAVAVDGRSHRMVQ